MRTPFVSLLGAALVSACATSHAYHDPIVTDRPDFTESTDAVTHGGVQVEAGDTFDRTDAVRSNAVGEVLVRVGVAPRTELRVGLNSIVHTFAVGEPRGREDATLGTKLELLRAADGPSLRPAVSLLAMTSVPSGSRPMRSTALTTEAKLALGWSIAEGWDVSSNLNVASIPEAGTRSHETVGSVSFGHDLAPRIGSFAEWYGTLARGAAGPQYVNGGLTLRLTPNAQLDARIGSGVGRAHGDYFFGIGAARRW